ncbi:unnamed protein product [Alopecurus aequalis]
MAQGRGSARVVLALVLLSVLLHGEVAESATYSRRFGTWDTAGDALSPSRLPGGKRFRAGDTLLFKYGRGAHNVVAVDEAGYRSCRAPRGARTFSSGNDRVTLSRGANYFICTVGNHCARGMKMQVNAA